MVHIIASDWLEPYRYPAIYAWPGTSVSGRLSVHAYASAGDLWLFKGTFDVEDDRAQAP